MRPDRQKILGPVLRGGVPIELYQPLPRSMIDGTLASVSTLLITVGRRYRPSTAGNGGRERGMGRRPSRDSSSAVSSPQIYAPAPRKTRIRTLTDVPRQPFPRTPAASDSATAASRQSPA